MLGIIGIKQLQVLCVIGVYPHERTIEQTLYIDLKVEADLKACALSDSLQDTVNYEALAEACRDIAKSGAFHLIETYAAHVLEQLCSRFPITWASITVHKPGALSEAEATFVELEHFNHELRSIASERKISHRAALLKGS